MNRGTYAENPEEYRFAGFMSEKVLSNKSANKIHPRQQGSEKIFPEFFYPR